MNFIIVNGQPEDQICLYDGRNDGGNYSQYNLITVPTQTDLNLSLLP
jgi:hypothetical protein